MFTIIQKNKNESKTQNMTGKENKKLALLKKELQENKNKRSDQRKCKNQESTKMNETTNQGKTRSARKQRHDCGAKRGTDNKDRENKDLNTLRKDRQ